MVVVVGGMFALRLHAFIALLLAALCVAALTAPQSIYQYEVDSRAIEIASVVDRSTVLLKASLGRAVIEGKSYLLRDGAGVSDPILINVESLQAADSKSGMTTAIVTGATLRAGDRIVHHTMLAAARENSRINIGEQVAIGFGDTAMSIGILIAMASIIGRCLLESGAAERIVVAARRLVGEKNTSFAFLGGGFVIGIPVFFDTAFYLLAPLGKAMGLKTGKHYTLYILTIVAGATMAHSLVPPTPGPLFVADQLAVDIGTMMLGGIFVGLFSITAGYFYAVWADRKWQIPIRPSAELSTEELQAMADRDESTLPPLWSSLFPILLPVFLIAGGTIFARIFESASDKPAWLSILLFLSNKNLALVIAALAALLVMFQRKGVKASGPAVNAALTNAGVIVLIISAGGAFGHVLRQTNIADIISGLVPDSSSALLWLPIAFLITMTIRTVQGSATVGMITAVGIVGPVLAQTDLGFHPVYLALAIGAGSKPFLWMNDAGFWVISKMSGFTEAETLKTVSVLSLIMGVTALIVTTIAAWLMPLV